MTRPTKRDVRIEGIASIIRERSRFPSGQPRMSPGAAREIAEAAYQYLVAEKVVRK